MIVLIAGFVLLLTDQGSDMLINTVEDGKTWQFSLALMFWGLSIWGWARFLLDIRFPDPPTYTAYFNFWRKWIPRALGALAFVVVGFSTYQANVKTHQLTWLSAVGMFIFVVIVIARRDATNKILTGMSNASEAVNKYASTLVAKYVPNSKVQYLSMGLENFATGIQKGASKRHIAKIEVDSIPPYADWKEAISDWRENAWLGFLFATGMSIGGLFLIFVSTAAPVYIGMKTGAMLLFFLWGATLLPYGSYISYFADKKGWPLLSGLAALALGLSFFNDNHEIRPVPEGVSVNIDARPTVTQALKNWAEVNPATDNKPAPFVIVATAGGGIRAAYWTGTVLGNIHDNISRFDDKLFAISGVSGGSVGGTVYRALLIPPKPFASAALPDKCNKMTGCIQQILGQDFLGPVAAGMLYPDLMQRFWPWPWFPDRGKALETAWETAFLNVTKQDNLNLSLADLSRQPRAWPALFLNATWVDNGRRIVASNLRYDTAPGDEATIFARSNDQLAILGYDLRLSTAAHNSARFPVVSPPGMWKKAGVIQGRLQDGGLFENYGAETALEIINLACKTFTCPTSDKTQRPNIQPIVILISSDPSLPEDLAKSPKNPPIGFAYELRATLTTYEQSRTGRGAEAAARLQAETEQRQGQFVHFRMCKNNDDSAKPPLGWSLSTAAQNTIKGYLPLSPKQDASECQKSNANAFSTLKNALNPDSSKQSVHQ